MSEPKVYTAEERELAANALSMYASNPVGLAVIRPVLGLPDDGLADLAWDHVYEEFVRDGDVSIGNDELGAEAEALVRSGWSPP